MRVGAAEQCARDSQYVAIASRGGPSARRRLAQHAGNHGPTQGHRALRIRAIIWLRVFLEAGEEVAANLYRRFNVSASPEEVTIQAILMFGENGVTFSIRIARSWSTCGLHLGLKYG